MYFDFADIPTEDKRETKYRSLFPIINSNNIYSLFKDYSDRPDYWNMNVVNKVVDIVEKNKEGKYSLILSMLLCSVIIGIMLNKIVIIRSVIPNSIEMTLHDKFGDEYYSIYDYKYISLGDWSIVFPKIYKTSNHIYLA